MAFKLPDGALVFLATTYGKEVKVTAISNAEKAVLTLETGHDIEKGDVFELVSGWSSLANRVFRADEVEGQAVTIKASTKDVKRHRVGSGVGHLRKITGWEEIQQILEFQGQGGEQQFATYETLDSDDEGQLPTKRSAQSISISIADDETLPGYQAWFEASEEKSIRALELLLSSGSQIFYNGYPTMNPTPTTTKGQVMAIAATFSMSGRPVRY